MPETNASPGGSDGSTTPPATTWDLRTVSQLLLRTIAIVVALIAIYQINQIFEAAETGRAAGPIVVTILMLVAAFALWWFADPIVEHMLRLRTDSGAAAAPPGETMVEAAKRPGGVLEWHAVFLSLLGIFLFLFYLVPFLAMLFNGFAGRSGAEVFITMLLLIVSALLAVIPRKLLLLLPMYKNLRPAKPGKESAAAGESATTETAPASEDTASDKEQETTTA